MSDNYDADSHGGGDCDAITSPSETGRSSSGKRKSRIGSLFRCWQFQINSNGLVLIELLGYVQSKNRFHIPLCTPGSDAQHGNQSRVA